MSVFELKQIVSAFVIVCGVLADKPLYLAHPQFEGFETIQTVGSGKTKTA